MLLPFQGVNAMAIRNPGCRFACPGLGAVALSGRALSAAPQQFKQVWLHSVCTIIQGIIGGTSTIQASLIAFGLHDNSVRFD